MSASSELGLQLWALWQQGWRCDAPQVLMVLVGAWCLGYLLPDAGLASALHGTAPGSNTSALALIFILSAMTGAAKITNASGARLFSAATTAYFVLR